MKYLNEFNNVIARYRAGEFGSVSLSLHDILERANDSDLIYKMDLSELQHLLDTSHGVTKKVFSLIKQKEKDKIVAMERLEKELKQFDIAAYRGVPDSSDEAMARNLGLIVKYCDRDELPKETEAMLCPAGDEAHLGLIKIQKDCVMSNFSFRHELIHYFRDVKVGNKVTTEFARKVKGKTPNAEEQEINYLTAASIMPVNEISAFLGDFENASTPEAEKSLLSSLAVRYAQDENAVLRRIIEVRCLVDYANSKTA